MEINDTQTVLLTHGHFLSFYQTPGISIASCLNLTWYTGIIKNLNKWNLLSFTLWVTSENKVYSVTFIRNLFSKNVWFITAE